MAYRSVHISHNLPQRKPAASGQFQDQYIALRHKEKRLYTDAQVNQLPVVAREHPHYQEWLARKRSSDRLSRYITKMNRPLSVLETGCGNGWLANKLAAVEQTSVTGFDINQVELQQAKRVFGHQRNLQFTSRDPFVAGTDEKLYDVIVFAASIQYFPSLEDTVANAMKLLKPGGEIHIMDTHFYKPEAVAAARQRTTEYYASLGFPGLSAHYFHHSLNALSRFDARVLYDPHTPWNRLTRRKDPFHWVCIKKS